MNLVQVRRCGNTHCLSHHQQTSIDHTTIFTRPVYQVDATILCQLIKQIERKNLSKSFGQLLYLAFQSQSENDRQICLRSNCGYQQRNVFLLTNIPDLISVAIDWQSSSSTTSDVEDFVSIIDPFVYLRELFYDVTTNEARIKQLNLIGLVCFYGGTVEVFFSYDHQTSKWLFCFDGNIVVSADWNAVQRKCIEFHLQPFLLIYANPDRDPVDISQLLKRTVIQTQNPSFVPDERRLEQAIESNRNSQTMLTKIDCQIEKISSFATLNSSMLFMPKTSINEPINSTYINQETVVKVMQQQFLKKENLSDTTSISSSSTSSPIIHVRHRTYQINPTQEETLSVSSQRDSGLSSDGSPRDSLNENEQTLIDGLIKQTERLMNDDRVEMSYSTIEHYLEESFKFERINDYSSALESCQQALVFIEQILNVHENSHHGISIYARTKKNSILSRIRSLENLQKTQFTRTSLTSTFKPIEKTEKIYDNNLSQTSTSILSSTTKLSRSKKSVTFSDHVALIVPRSDDTNEPPSEHLIHSFLRQIHQQQVSTNSDSDSDTPSSTNETSIGLTECALCHKRCSKQSQIGTYCSNCHFYMQRFQPTV